MSTIRRDDGIQFVIQPYRELFAPGEKGRATLKRRIRMLAEKRGTNARVFALPNGKIEVIFSPEPGFLLGETVWYYLNKPNNLIYCEALPERRQALIVVIRNGMIFMDSKASFNELLDEFAFLSTTDEKYDIYTFGDVPLGQTKDEPGKFTFNDKIINTFNVLDEPAFTKLPVYELAQLQPLEIAVTSPELGKSKIVPIFVAFLILATLWVGWQLIKQLTISAAPIKQRFEAINLPIDPYISFYQDLSAPEPIKQLHEFINTVDLVASLPGWEITAISYANQNYNLQLDNPKGGSLSSLQKWADMNKIDMQLSTSGTNINIQSYLQKRSKPTAIYPLKQVLATLIDQLNILLPGKNITLGNISSNIKYSDASVDVKFDSVLPGKLLAIGNFINNFPVSILSINASIKDGLLSGNITLKVLGD